MIHTVLVIALALRAEAEFKLRVCELRPSADHTAVPCGLSVGSGDRNSTLPLTDAPHILRETGTVRVERLLKIPSALHLLRGIVFEIPRREEENEEIEKRRHKCDDRDQIIQVPLQDKADVRSAVIQHHDKIQDPEPFYLNGTNKVEIHPRVRKCRGKGQEHRHHKIICAEERSDQDRLSDNRRKNKVT